MKLLHKHHVIPKHMGGSDDPSNLVELTVEEHAEAHKKLFEQHGHWQDKIAWQALAGQIGLDDAIQEARGAANRGKKRTPEQIERIRQAAILRNQKWKDSGRMDEINAKRSASHKGKIKTPEHIFNNTQSRVSKGYKHSEETRNKISESLKGNTNRISNR
jgi:hypothetical protein